jgi:hypothetical protein
MQDGGNTGEGVSFRGSSAAGRAGPPIRTRPPLQLEIRAQFLEVGNGPLPLRSDDGNGLGHAPASRSAADGAPPSARQDSGRTCRTAQSEAKRAAATSSARLRSQRQRGRHRRFPGAAATRDTLASNRTPRRGRHGDSQAASDPLPCPCIQAFARETPSRHAAPSDPPAAPARPRTKRPPDAVDPPSSAIPMSWP